MNNPWQRLRHRLVLGGETLYKKTEADERIRTWARIRLGGERGVEVGREHGCADSSGVTQTIKRLEARAAKDKAIAKKLQQLTELSKVND